MSSATFDSHLPVVSTSATSSTHFSPVNQLPNCSLNYINSEINIHNNMFAPSFHQSNMGHNLNFVNNTSSNSSLNESPTTLSLGRNNLVLTSTDSGISSSNASVTEQMLLINSGQGTICANSYVSVSPNNDYDNTPEPEEPEPMSRDRCNTWPMRRPNLETNVQTSPLMHDRIPEEEGSNEDDSPGNETPDNQSDQFFDLPPEALLEGNGDLTNGGAAGKKITTRRNAWGNMSYADLITKAIQQSPEQRLTLSQVYEWMVQNIPYFRDKGDSNSSAGWKNSIRHNLSLHNRFVRVQNEGAGKSSWWMINPDASTGRNPRRRAATMESTTKNAMDKKRRMARKRVDAGMRASMQSINESAGGSQLSINSHDLFSNDIDEPLAPQFENFRQRTQSNVSMSANISPPRYDDYEINSWPNNQNNNNNMDTTPQQNQAVNELLTRTDQMRLDSSNERRLTNGSPKYLPQIKEEYKYHEIPQAPQQMRSNIMHCQPAVHHLISQRTKPVLPPTANTSSPYYTPNNFSPMPTHAPMGHNSPQNQGSWIPPHPMQYRPQGQVPPPPSYQQHQELNLRNMDINPTALIDHRPMMNQSALPMDLENLSVLDPGMIHCDVEAVLRHEMSHSDNPQLQLHFDL